MSTDPNSTTGETAEQPGKVKAIAIMTLVGGIIAAIVGLTNILLAVGLCVTLFTGIYSIVVSVLCIIKGIKLLGKEAHLQAPPKTTAILQIINILCCDGVNLAMGIVILVFLNDPEVKAYYRGT